jgi:hypothetical protein
MSPPMPPRKSVLDSPSMQEQMQAENEANGHVTRGEFRALRADVHEIKQALLGDMALGNGVLAQHHDMRKKVNAATKLAWAAVIGASGLIGHAIWNLIEAKRP